MSTEFAPSAEEGPINIESALFDRQTGGIAGRLVNAVAHAPGVSAGGAASVTYDRKGALKYARNFWNVPCDDQFIAIKATGKNAQKVPSGTTFVHESGGREHALLPDGSRIEWEHLDDCTHFISCCIGERPGQPSGELPIPYKQLGAPPAAPYGIVRVSTMVDFLIGKKVKGINYAEIVAEKSDDEDQISRLQSADIIAYYNTAKKTYSHMALYLGDGKIACHTYCRSDLPDCTWDNDWFLGRGTHLWTFLRFIV